ncbi:MAG: hypothetical protein QMD04_12920 [Anaerolineales bacterium]|nr:hypothetical protein [Anaerolineales bacterium]
MNELFTIKYDELLTEFNRYVMTHPKFLAGIPDEALIILVDPNDPEFSRYNLERVRAYRRNDDKPDRPVVYVDVGALAPVRSRLVRPRVLPRLPDALAVAS